MYIVHFTDCLLKVFKDINTSRPKVNDKKLFYNQIFVHNLYFLFMCMGININNVMLFSKFHL